MMFDKLSGRFLLERDTSCSTCLRLPLGNGRRLRWRFDGVTQLPMETLSMLLRGKGCP